MWDGSNAAFSIRSHAGQWRRAMAPRGAARAAARVGHSSLHRTGTGGDRKNSAPPSDPQARHATAAVSEGVDGRGEAEAPEVLTDLLGVDRVHDEHVGRTVAGEEL